MQVIERPSFYVIGISDRTHNVKELAGSGVIGAMWQRFFSESHLSRISNRVDNDIIAVYFDYADGRDGEYNFLLGARVSDIYHVPDGMVAYQVPAQKYVVFTSSQGKMPDVEVALWKEIWALEDIGQLDRAYGADYVVYDERSHNPEHAVVDIYIGLKNTTEMLVGEV